MNGSLRAARLALTALALCSFSSAARADDEPAQEPYFYKGRDYGSEALYGPIWVFLNRGFDVLQDRTGSRNLVDQEYIHNGANVGRNILNPFPAIKARGYGVFFRQEIFPLSWTADTARWVPNYSLHLIGGGQTYSELSEWYRANGVPLPRVFAATTVMASAFMNETLENKGVVGWNTDAIADIYFFDIGGIILFSFDWPNWLFSHEILLADWSLQPSFTYPTFELHNEGNYYAVKWPLPFYRDVRLFMYMGLGTLFGLSYKFDSQYSLSLGGGTMASRLIASSRTNADNTVQFAPMAGVFLDRNNSLLASLKVTGVQDYFVNFNVYPNAFQVPQLGFWSVVDRGGHFITGVVFSQPFGVGFGIGNLPE
ncbi:MAG TPA: hypothetical protein VGI10_21645 [Polyangiaceae bacterium]